MKNPLKVLALCAGVLILSAPAYAQTAEQPLVLPHRAPVSPAATAAPVTSAAPDVDGAGAQQKAPSYDDLKASFIKMSQAMTLAVSGPEVTKAASDLQSDVADLAKIETQYSDAKSDPKSTQAQLDALVGQYTAKVQEIEEICLMLDNTEQQMVSAVNLGLQALHGADDQKASADPDVKKAVESLQALLDAKFAAPVNLAQAAIQSVLAETQRAVKAQMPALIKRDLTQAVKNRLESKAAQ